MGISKKNKMILYLLAALIGCIVCGIYVFSLVKAYKLNDRSNMVVSAIILLVWIAFTIIYVQRFLQEKKSN